jgi:hypothetical protein
MSMGLGEDTEHPEVKREINRLADMALRKGD